MACSVPVTRGCNEERRVCEVEGTVVLLHVSSAWRVGVDEIVCSLAAQELTEPLVHTVLGTIERLLVDMGNRLPPSWFVPRACIPQSGPAALISG